MTTNNPGSTENSPRLRALSGRIEKMKTSTTIRPKHIFRELLTLDLDARALDAIEGLVLEVDGVRRLSANECAVEQIEELFHLRWSDTLWTLIDDIKVDVPERLVSNLGDLEYEAASEAKCQVSVDIMLIQCLVHLRRHYEKHHKPKSTSTPIQGRSAKNRCFMYPEQTIQVEVVDARDSPVVFTGRADWCFGCGTDETSLLVAIKAKKEAEFSKGKSHLLAYLAMLRHERTEAGITNFAVQGFYSDGRLYQFITISAEDVIQSSKFYDTKIPNEMKIVFNFIISLLDIDMKKTPNASPVKNAHEEVGINLRNGTKHSYFPGWMFSDIETDGDDYVDLG